jgi:hypothetical protein
MAVSQTLTRNRYIGNGSTSVPYPTGFFFGADSWLRVHVTENGASRLLILGTDYTVTGAGNTSGGNVFTLAAYPAATVVTITRKTPIIQLLDMGYNNLLPSQLVEDALDKNILISQELADVNALTFPLTEPPTNVVELPDAALRKSTVLGFDSITGEAVLFETPVPVVPVAAPLTGIFILGAVNGVLQWIPTVNC